VYEYLTGPCTLVYLAPKFKLQASALLGIVTMSYPELTLAWNDTVSLTFDFLGGGIGFGYSIGAGIEYSISDNVSLLLNVSYTGTTISYNSSAITWNSPGYYPYVENHPNDATTMSTGIIKPTIGVVFKL
jgi:hypothetical protein